MPFKDFAAGDVLTAADVDNLLMRQTVMRFADATARDTALSAVLAEGMIAYLDDTDEILKYTGATWVNVAPASGPSPDDIITTEGDLIIGDSSADAVRIGIGAVDTVLTSDGTTAAWVAPGAPSSNWDELATGALTGATTISVTGFASRDKYFLLLNGATVGANGRVDITINNKTSGYRSGYVRILAGASYSPNILEGSNFLSAGRIPIGEMSASATDVINGSAFIEGGRTSSDKFFQFSGSGSQGGSNGHEAYIGSGVLVEANPITTLEIKSSSGNFTAGDYYLYGSD
jgi:hypothetical protein